MKNKKITKIIFLFFLLYAVAMPFLSLAADIKYEPMEAIPGFGYPSNFPDYIISIFKFGIWIAGISAVIMIMVGGYIYMTSAGNNARMEKAKGIITDAIIGLILALTSWLLLYIINPHLTQIETFSDPINPKVLDDLGDRIKLKKIGGEKIDLENYGQD